MVLGALAVREDAPELAERVVMRAVTHLPGAMEAIYGSSGMYTEGPMYWGYGTIFNVMLIDALRTALGDTFGLDRCEGFFRSADYYLHMTGPTGQYFNYCDCRAAAVCEPAMYWFARRLDRPDLLHAEVRQLGSALAERNEEARRRRLNHRLLPLLAVWSPPLAQVGPPTARHWLGQGRFPAAVHRSGWDREATFVGIKGGSPAQPHGHMDIGAFVLDALGVRWAIDLGLQEYETLGVGIWDTGQESDRWRVFRNNNLSHNTLAVNGAHQRVDGCAPVVSFSGDEATPHTEIDMVSVYAGQLSEARRRVTLQSNGAVVIRDRLRANAARGNVRWGMVTGARIEIVSPTRAILRCDGKAMCIDVLAPASAHLRIWDTASPPAAHDAPNPGTCMIGFEVALLPHEPVELRVLLQPSSSDRQMASSP